MLKKLRTYKEPLSDFPIEGLSRSTEGVKERLIHSTM